MPVKILNKSFLDNFGNSLAYYRGNVGDRFNVSLQIESNIRLSSVNNPITIDITTGQHYSPSKSWIDEGFRAGDTINVTKYNGSGVALLSWTATVNYVDDQILDISPNQTGAYSIAALEQMVYTVTSRGRDDLDVFLNHVQNGLQGSELSLLDGEATRLSFPGVDALSVGSSIIANLPPNQSGQMVISGNLQRLPDPAPNAEYKRIYQLSIDFVLTGLYNSALFSANNCLKLYLKLLWASIGGEPYDRTELILNDDADTGWLNEPYNSGLPNSELLQGVAELDYCEPTTFEIIVDGSITELGMGAAYVSNDDTYFKNRPTAGQAQTMLIPSVDLTANPTPFPLISNQNEFNAGYTITINSINTVGTETTINATFTPNAAFNTFMSNREEGDRLFYLWLKAGTINHLAFADQLTCAPPVGGPLTMESSFPFLDHSQNVTEIAGDYNGFTADIEDDLAYFGTFKLEKGANYEGLNVIIEAFNSTTGDAFTLQSLNFGFGGVQISGDGRYLLNEVQNVLNTLPNNSEKLNALLRLEPSLDTPTEYGAAIYYPFLLRWEYWLQQLNANADFWPDQNKDWFNYNNLLPWTVRLRLQLIKDGLSYEHSEQINFFDYDNEDLINTKIELVRVSTGQVVPLVIEGEQMMVRATHVLTANAWYDFENIWGMITVEPKEAARRWICSSVLPFDNNNANPLTPLDGVQMVITFPLPNRAVMECYFNPDLINLANGVKFTSKIKGCIKDPEILKTTTTGDTKTTTTGDDKTLAI